VRVLDDEVRATRYRLRAVQDRWVRRLEQALAEVTFTLEEQERADAARLRLATRRADLRRAKDRTGADPEPGS
jgi:V/A-type H+/Na+-transporting ATPase subunit D